MEDTQTNLKCDDCGKEKEDVTETVCPYALEINDEEYPMNLCTNCYHERAMDI